MQRRAFQFGAAICAVVGILSIAPARLWAQDPQQTQAQTPPAPEDDPANPPANDPQAMLPHFKDTRFWVSGQMNFIFQTHPDFHAPYSAPHSLSPHYEKATSRGLPPYPRLPPTPSTPILSD